jgi:glycosyltransferase involved in cell wall biosynthesis
MAKSKKKVLLVANTAWYVFNFRLGVIRHFQSQHFETVAVTPYDEFCHALQAHGCRWIGADLDARGINPFSDACYWLQLYRIYSEEQPSLVIHYTIKPNIYGTLAARLLRIPSVAVISGAGHAFSQRNMLYHLAKFLLKVSLHFSHEVWFVNHDDRSLFISEQVVRAEKAYLFPGEGINTQRFCPSLSQVSEPREKVVFLFAGRLLREKGVELYAQAARQLKPKYPHAEFYLLGFLSEGNPAFVSKAELTQWQDYVHYLGSTQNIIPYIESADCLVLPSVYREGIPRILLEAASLAKPIITTNHVGCRDVVEHSVTGFLVQPNSVSDLLEKMEQMITMPSVTRVMMGERGRQKVIQQFDESLVIRCYDEMLTRLHLL